MTPNPDPVRPRAAFRLVVAANAASLLFLSWLYGADLLDALAARGAEVVARSQPPAVIFAALVLVAALACAGAVAWALFRRKDASFRGYRLLPIVTVVAVFVDLFVVSASNSPLRSSDQLALHLRQFQLQATQIAAAAGTVDQPEALRASLAELGAPPYLVRGKRPPAYALEVRQGCAGPVAEAGGVAVGTLIFCVSADRRTAWVTAVALPVEARSGSPAIWSERGVARFALVTVPPPEEETDWLAAPLFDDVGDAGNP